MVLQGERMQQAHPGQRLTGAGKELELVGAKEDLAAGSPTRAGFDLGEGEHDAGGGRSELAGSQAVSRDIDLQVPIAAHEALGSLREYDAGGLHRDLPDVRSGQARGGWGGRNGGNVFAQVRRFAWSRWMQPGRGRERRVGILERQ